MDYWQGMVTCKRKALAHITHVLCLEKHDLRLCDDCPNFMNILRQQEESEWDQVHRVEELKTLRSKKKGGDK